MAPHVLSAGLAVVTLAPSLVRVGASASITSAGAFVVCTSHTSRSVAVTAQHHEVGNIRRSFVGAVTPASASWATPRCRALYHCCQPTTMGSGGKGREIRGYLSRRVRKLLRPLRESASSSAEEARGGLVSTGGEQGKVRRSSVGGGDATEYGGVDLTAPTEVKRPASIRAQMLQMLKPDLPRITLSVLWAVVGTAAALSVPLAYAGVVTCMLDPSLPSSRLTKAVGMLGLAYTVEPMSTYFYVRCMSGVIDRAAGRLKVMAFRALLAQEVAFFDLAGSAELSAAVTTDVLAAKAAVQGNLQRDRGLRAVLETVFGLGVLLKLSPRLAWIFYLVIPVAAWGLAESRKRLALLGQEEGKSLGMEAAIAAEAVRNIREVRGFGAEARELSRFQAATQGAAVTSTKIGAASGRLEALNRAAIYVSILAVMYVGGRLVMSGAMSAALLLSFVGFCFSLNFAMQGVNFTIDDARRGQAALERVFQVMSPAAGIPAKMGMDVISPRDLEGRVDFRNVHFTYPTRPDKAVFSGLDLSLPAGKVTALVGYSGGGKSTIAALLSRFYTPTRGNILIDGVDVTDLDRRWLTQKMALVGQNPALFTGTIAQNIAYGMASNGMPAGEDNLGGVSMEDIEQAAELANARGFIEEFSDGFSTFIGEGGVQLSGGQRQRIAIARAVLKDARILLLDEATSALDAHSEALVQQALSRLMEGRTVLVIAHRLSTVVKADKICVLSQGKVIEEGTHDDLLERRGAYSNLMSTQVRSFSTIGD